MSPATEWVIQHDDVAIVNRAGFDGGGDRHRHRSQMHRHVIAHGDYLAFAVENRAGIIAPLFDVGRKCRSPKGSTHFFRDGMVDALEDFQFDGIARHEAQCNGFAAQLQRGSSALGFQILRLVLKLRSRRLA